MKKALILLALLVGIAIVGVAYIKWDDIRSSTAYLVALLPPRMSRPVLIRFLDSSDELVVADAAYQLGRVGGDEVYGPLTKAIGHPIPMVRHNAINAMIFLNQSDRAISETIKCTDNVNEEVFVIDSAIGLLGRQTRPDNKVMALDALQRLRKRNQYPNLNTEIDTAIRTLAQ